MGFVLAAVSLRIRKITVPCFLSVKVKENCSPSPPPVWDVFGLPGICYSLGTSLITECHL